MKSKLWVLGHSLVRLFDRSHCSLICLLCTSCFVRVLRCAHSLAQSLAPELMGSSFCLCDERASYNFIPLGTAAIAIGMLFQFIFANSQLPFCLKIANFSDFGGCCKLWQVAAKASGCFKLLKIEWWMYKYPMNASRNYGVNRCFHLSVTAICSKFKWFFAANAACGLRSTHFSVFLALESCLRGQKTCIEVFTIQWWHGINEKNVVNLDMPEVEKSLL